MSKIEFEQISEDVVEVIIPPETPLEIVQQLTKSLLAKGLVEDPQESTLSVRYFYRPEDKANVLADELLKTLSGMAKADELPAWHPKAQMAHQKKLRQQGVADRQAKAGVGKTPAVPKVKPMTPAQYTEKHPRMYDQNSNTAGGSGKRYAYINDIKKDEDEHVEGCRCDQCLDKSDYGVKGTSLYNPADNAKRKANNTSDVAGIGPNKNVKAISTKPGQMSGKQQASVAAKIQARANKKQPVKHFSPEEIAAHYGKQPMKKAWGEHLPFPSAEEEIMKFAAADKTQRGDDALANQLANFMSGKAMLGTAPPPQPTNEEMFGHLVVTEEMAKAKQQEWGGTLNNFYAEASKPLTNRFANEEEELAYWNSIKVADRDDGSSGY